MPEGYLSPAEARKVKLPFFRRGARYEQIQTYAGAMATGKEKILEPMAMAVDTKRALVVLAVTREALDRQERIFNRTIDGVERLDETTQYIDEASKDLAEQIRTYLQPEGE